jgi:hypothetical protein
VTRILPERSEGRIRPERSEGRSESRIESTRRFCMPAAEGPASCRSAVSTIAALIGKRGANRTNAGLAYLNHIPHP